MPSPTRIRSVHRPGTSLTEMGRTHLSGVGLSNNYYTRTYIDIPPGGTFLMAMVIAGTLEAKVLTHHMIVSRM